MGPVAEGAKCPVWYPQVRRCHPTCYDPLHAEIGPSHFVAVVSCHRQDVLRQDYTQRLLVGVAMLQKSGFRRRSTRNPLEFSRERLAERLVKKSRRVSQAAHYLVSFCLSYFGNLALFVV